MEPSPYLSFQTLKLLEASLAWCGCEITARACNQRLDAGRRRLEQCEAYIEVGLQHGCLRRLAPFGPRELGYAILPES